MFFVHLRRFATTDDWRQTMLAQYFYKLTRSQLNKRAVKSLEFGMIVMLVAVASVGALGASGTHVSTAAAQISTSTAQVAAAAIQVASAK
jgi:Flp pilus assembly pilin Flp